MQDVEGAGKHYYALFSIINTYYIEWYRALISMCIYMSFWNKNMLWVHYLVFKILIIYNNTSHFNSIGNDLSMYRYLTVI
jgi:hypothetical protein